MPQVLDPLPNAFRETAASLPARRTGRNTRYPVCDAAGCAPACWFTRCESFLEFQWSMERDGSRSNCRTLFGAGRIPRDNRPRNLLDGLDPAASGERSAVEAGFRRSASGRGPATGRTRGGGGATALPAVRRSRGAVSVARPLG